MGVGTKAPPNSLIPRTPPHPVPTRLRPPDAPLPVVIVAAQRLIPFRPRRGRLVEDEFEQPARGRLVDIHAKAVLAFDRRHTTYIPAAVPLGQPFGEISDNLSAAVEDESGEGELERVGSKGRARGRGDGEERILTPPVATA